MILWCDGPHDPAEQMRRDALLLAGAEAGAEPVLRLFRFAPFGITIGRGQDPARELDLDRCARDRVQVATRPTGGRAIFHADEWTYSLSAPLADGAWGGSPAEAFARASRCLLASLVRLGIPATLAPRGGDRPPRPQGREGPAPPCFASTARHEIVIAGRKLVGSAQRRTGRGLLQQGSVLIGPGHLRLADYLAAPAAHREAVRGALARATAGAGPWLGPDPPLERWADGLAAVLPPCTRRLSGAAGAALLTAAQDGSYTRASSN